MNRIPQGGILHRSSHRQSDEAWFPSRTSNHSLTQPSQQPAFEQTEASVASTGCSLMDPTTRVIPEGRLPLLTAGPYLVIEEGAMLHNATLSGIVKGDTKASEHALCRRTAYSQRVPP